MRLTSDDGTKIWAESAGDSSKPPVVFIHGFAHTSLTFEKQFSDKRLLTRLHLVRYDLRGHGRSDAPLAAESYESSRHAQDFRTVCDAFNIKRPIIAGWSMGGLIPVDVASEYGVDFLSGIVYLGSHPYREAFPRVASEAINLLAPNLCSLDTSHLRDTAVEFISCCVADPAVIPYETMIAWVGAVIMQAPVARLHVSRRSQDERRFLEEGGQALPVLVIHGVQDKIIKASEAAAVMRETFDNVDIRLVDGVGHAPFYEKPEEVGEMILEFVNRIFNSG